MSEQAKTMGEVALDGYWRGRPSTNKDAWEACAAAVIAAHEAAQWRPMSEQDEAPTRALLAYEVDSVRYVTACIIDWRYDDSQPERYISDDDGEPIFVPGAVIALAWQHMPKPPEVPR